MRTDELMFTRINPRRVSWRGSADVYCDASLGHQQPVARLIDAFWGDFCAQEGQTSSRCELAGAASCYSEPDAGQSRSDRASCSGDRPSSDIRDNHSLTSPPSPLGAL